MNIRNFNLIIINMIHFQSTTETSDILTKVFNLINLLFIYWYCFWSKLVEQLPFQSIQIKRWIDAYTWLFLFILINDLDEKKIFKHICYVTYLVKKLDLMWHYSHTIINRCMEPSHNDFCCYGYVCRIHLSSLTSVTFFVVTIVVFIVKGE